MAKTQGRNIEDLESYNSDEQEVFKFLELE